MGNLVEKSEPWTWFAARTIRERCYRPDGKPPAGWTINRDLRWWKAAMAKGKAAEQIAMAIEGVPLLVPELRGRKWSPAKVFSKAGGWVSLFERAITIQGRRGPSLIGDIILAATERARAKQREGTL